MRCLLEGKLDFVRLTYASKKLSDFVVNHLNFGQCQDKNRGSFHGFKEMIGSYPFINSIITLLILQPKS